MKDRQGFDRCCLLLVHDVLVVGKQHCWCAVPYQTRNRSDINTSCNKFCTECVAKVIRTYRSGNSSPFQGFFPCGLHAFHLITVVVDDVIYAFGLVCLVPFFKNRYEALTKTGAEQLKAEMTGLDVSIRKDVLSLFAHPDRHCTDPETGAELWYWSWLKWYVDYPDVHWTEDFINRLDDGDFMFVRLGDDADDNEERGQFWGNPFDLGLVREIRFVGK